MKTSTHRSCAVLGAGLSALLAFSCADAPPPPVAAPPHLPAPPVPPPPPPPDVLGARPDVPTPAPFAPPAPVVFAGPNGLTVWLLERHTLPFVAVTVAVPSGGSSDPKGKGGVANAGAMMQEQGAGARGAIELSRAVDTLGATLGVDASADASTVSLTVLKKNLGAAFLILGDVVVRPRFEPAEWKRAHDLWLDALKERASDPEDVAHVVERVVLFGPDSPYGHPVDGTLESARRVSLDDAKSFYRSAWRPDRAVLVAVGDVTREELAPLLTGAFGGWKAPGTPPPAPLAPPAPTGPWPRAVLIDRADAPQSIVAVVRPGVAAASPEAPPLWRVNAAIGGSFTSRLNQDLREEHGWSYGAHSHVGTSRGVGPIAVSAAVVADKTLDALQAMLADLELFANKGLTAEEVDKTRSQARADTVQAYVGAGGLAGRLALDAVLGLGPGYEGSASLLRDAATKESLDRLASEYYSPAHAVTVIVGPRGKIEGGLGALGLAPAEVRNVDGNVVKDHPPAPPAAPRVPPAP